MVAFGVILALVGVGGGALIAWLASQSSTGITVEWAGMSITVMPVTLFFCGVLATLLLWVGWRLTVVGIRRRRAEREEIKQLRSSASTQAATAAPSSSAKPAPATQTSSVPRAANTAEVSGTPAGSRPVRGPMD